MSIYILDLDKMGRKVEMSVTKASSFLIKANLFFLMHKNVYCPHLITQQEDAILDISCVRRLMY